MWEQREWKVKMITLAFPLTFSIFVFVTTFIEASFVEGLGDKAYYLYLLVPIFLPITIYINNLDKENTKLVLATLLEAFWKNADQIPKRNSIAMRAIYQTAVYGKVTFPAESVPQKSGINEFFYPANHFGGDLTDNREKRK